MTGVTAGGVVKTCCIGDRIDGGINTTEKMVLLHAILFERLWGTSNECHKKEVEMRKDAGGEGGEGGDGGDEGGEEKMDVDEAKEEGGGQKSPAADDPYKDVRPELRHLLCPTYRNADGVLVRR